MPLMGLGTYKADAGVAERVVYYAIKVGYRHIDCTKVYGNEEEVGRGIRRAIAEGIVTREEMFITSKLWNTDHAPEHVLPACETTLENIGLDYLDLYLIHWPIALFHGEELFPRNSRGELIYTNDHYLETWKVMESLVDKGLCKSIGLSNFNSRQIDEVMNQAKIKPAVLQIESHPYLTQEPLIEFCKDKGIAVTAYSPLVGAPRPWARPDDPSILDDPKLKTIADCHKKTPAQILIRFQTQRGLVVIPKSSNESRIKLNFETQDFDLSTREMHTIRGFNRDWRAMLPAVIVGEKIIPRDKNSPFFPY